MAIATAFKWACSSSLCEVSGAMHHISNQRALIGLGMMRSIEMDRNVRPDVVPADVAAGNLIAIAAQRATGQLRDQIVHVTYQGQAYGVWEKWSDQHFKQQPMLSAIRPLSYFKKNTVQRWYTKIVSEWLLVYMYHFLFAVVLRKKM